MPSLGPTELIIIALVLVLLFGARRLPDTARAIGRSMRIFKSETKGLRDDDIEDKPAAQPTQLPPVQQQSPQVPPPQQQSPQVAPPLEQTQGRNDFR